MFLVFENGDGRQLEDSSERISDAVCHWNRVCSPAIPIRSYAALLQLKEKHRLVPKRHDVFLIPDGADGPADLFPD